VSVSREVRLLTLIAWCWSLSLPAAADPIPLPLGEWATFSWVDLGPINSPSDGFTLTTSVPVNVRVTDCCVTGDAFDLLVNGDVAASSPLVEGDLFRAGEADEAWADPLLSKLLLPLPAGQYHLAISTRALAPCCLSGAGFIRADPVPEPSTMTLVGFGIMALGFCAFRRARPVRRSGPQPDERVAP
jgi:hypothetical protein